MLEIKKLVKKYPPFSLEIEHLKVKNGKITALVGENGAGKTTLLRCIANLISNYQGEILIEGKKFTGKEKDTVNKISFMSEESFYINDFNSNEHFQIARKMSRYWDPEICDNLIQKLCLDIKKPIKELSRGNKIKLGIILALSRLPRFVIMDEPTTSLDPIMHQIIIEEINYWNKNSTTFLISSHSLDDIKTLADEIIIIKNGKITDHVNAKSENLNNNIRDYVLSSLKKNK